MEFLEPYWDYIVIAIIAVVALIVLTMVLRAFGGRVRGRKGKRLGVSEYRELDQTRRLMLIRRDDVEHLIMVGGGHSLVIEQNIGGHGDYIDPPVSYDRQAPELMAADEPEFDPEPVHRPAPRAPEFTDRPPNIRPTQREAPNFGRNEDY